MISEEKLREAARRAELIYVSRLPDPGDCHVEFSPRFERRMKKMVLRVDHPVVYYTRKSAACFLLAVLLSATLLFGCSAEAREAFFGWVREVFGTHVSYSYDGEETPLPNESLFLPEWVPEGYQLIEMFTPGNQTEALYGNDSGDILSFSYTSDRTSATLNISGENLISTEVMICNSPGTFYLDPAENEPNVLVWSEPEQGLFFWITGQLSKDEMVRMAESVSPMSEK